MLINLSNHPLSEWGEAQRIAAEEYGPVVDIPFPAVDACGDEQYIAGLADKCVQDIKVVANGSSITIHIMGEHTLTYAILYRLRRCGIPCIASTSRRLVSITESGEKLVTFQFEKFRYYE